MAVFPALNPIYAAPKQTRNEAQRTMLGDGYEKSLIFGLNTIRPEWQLTWLVYPEDAATIEDFLQARADAAEWFEWQPPDAPTTQRWRCDEWTVEQDNPVVYRINATFRRVFELVIPTLTTEPGECPDDALCWDNCLDISGLGPVSGIDGIVIPIGAPDVPLAAPSGIPTSGCNYQWYADGELIPGATSQNYTPTIADTCKDISLKVTCDTVSGTISGPKIIDPPLYWPTPVCGNAYTRVYSRSSIASCPGTSFSSSGGDAGVLFGPSTVICAKVIAACTKDFDTGKLIPGPLTYSFTCGGPSKNIWNNGVLAAGSSLDTLSKVEDLWGANGYFYGGFQGYAMHMTYVTAFVLQTNVSGLGSAGENVATKMKKAALEEFGANASTDPTFGRLSICNLS